MKGLRSMLRVRLADRKELVPVKHNDQDMCSNILEQMLTQSLCLRKEVESKACIWMYFRNYFFGKGRLFQI